MAPESWQGDGLALSWERPFKWVSWGNPMVPERGHPWCCRLEGTSSRSLPILTDSAVSTEMLYKLPTNFAFQDTMLKTRSVEMALRLALSSRCRRKKKRVEKELLPQIAAEGVHSQQCLWGLDQAHGEGVFTVRWPCQRQGEGQGMPRRRVEEEVERK